MAGIQELSKPYVVPFRIQDLKGILKQFEAETYHPLDPRYIMFWQGMRKKCVEGIWYPQGNEWRYVPGRLGFYGNYFTLVDTNEEDKTRFEIAPTIRDVEWLIAYAFIEAFGFSGFENDDVYTSDSRILNAKKSSMTLKQKAFFVRSNGTFKEYVNPQEYLYSLHDSPKGRPLYHNGTKNFSVMGSRGSGKSYGIAGMGAKYELVFDGQKYYNIGEPFQKTKALIDIGSGKVDKSSELIEKIVTSMERLSTDPKFGVWGNPEDDDYEPCPFYKIMEGSYKANNKENPWINEYMVKKKSKWVREGTGSTLFHTVYSINKKEGGAAGAGGRRNLVIYEETGLTPLLVEAWLSNQAVVTTNGMQFGVQVGIGTSGNIETVQPAQSIMMHPVDYNCIEFNGTGLYLPASMVNKDFKDGDGNTDLAAGTEFYLERRKVAANSPDPRIILNERMNYPLDIEDMWLAYDGGLLPSKEAEKREKELLSNNLYETLGTAIELYWDSNSDNGVNYTVKTQYEPIYEWPLKPGKSIEGEFMMYISPEKLKVNGMLPNDAVFILHDPYISDEWDKGGSLGASYWIVNPKYNSYGLPGNRIAATYIGKHPNGVDGYNEILEKGCAFYGNPVRGLWYEANRGDKVRAYFIKRKKAHVLCLRPQFEQGQFLYEKSVSQTGYLVGDKVAKLTLVDALRDWLLSQIEVNEIPTPIIETIPCLFTIRQIKQYTLNGNFDGVSALLGLSLAIGEQTFYADRKSKSSAIGLISSALSNKVKYGRYIRS